MSPRPLTCWQRILELLEAGHLDQAAALYARSRLAEDASPLDESSREALSTLLPLIEARLAEIRGVLREQERRLFRWRSELRPSQGSDWVG